MKLPYGISDFKALRNENYLYIDKTNFIEQVESLASKYLFFIRPRRFGKSLFLSTLSYYYDLKAKDQFNDLFGDLYIGENPTKLKNSYLVLKLNFSGLSTDSKQKLKSSFRKKLKNTIEKTINKYKDLFPKTSKLTARIRNEEDISAILEIFLNEVQKTDYKIYLIIDEYDHFANDIIAVGKGEFYKEIIRATGFVRDFYETVKIGTESVIDRIFITGISPVMLDDLTSGFNIASNITLDEEMNEMLGFTEQEVKSIMEKLNIKEQDILVSLQEYYNGYLFSIDGNKRVYNPDMILYYFNKLIKKGKQPRDLIDDNVKTDYGRLNRLVANQKNREVLDKVIQNEGITADIITKFSFDRMYDNEYFVSLLFYMGLLTIAGTRYGKTRLGIPNYVTKEIFWEYFERKLRDQFNIYYDTEELARSIWQMGFEGQIEPFINYVTQNVLQKLSNRDLINFDEKYIKIVLFSYLITSNLYKPVSEREVENGYLDIYLEKDIRMPDVEYEWVIELKYLKQSEQDKLEEVKEEGLDQLKRYVKSRGFEDKEDLKQALLIFIGKDEFDITVRS